MVIFARYGAELTVAELMKRLGVSRPYTTDFVGALERAGLLLKGEGFRAGYTLGREAAEITLLDIVQAEKDSWYYRKQLEREASLPEFAEARIWGLFAEEWLSSVTLAMVAFPDGEGLAVLRAAQMNDLHAIGRDAGQGSN